MNLTVGEKRMGKEETEVLGKAQQIKDAAEHFKENVKALTKGMNVENKGWHFTVSTSEAGVEVDVAVKLLITKTKAEKK